MFISCYYVLFFVCFAHHCVTAVQVWSRLLSHVLSHYCRSAHQMTTAKSHEVFQIFEKAIGSVPSETLPSDSEFVSLCITYAKIRLYCIIFSWEQTFNSFFPPSQQQQRINPICFSGAIGGYCWKEFSFLLCWMDQTRIESRCVLLTVVSC